MDLINLIDHPELLNKETLYLLRQEVASHPYSHVARLLYLQNLFLLRDASFGDELRRTALYLPDRSVLYDMIVKPAQLQESKSANAAPQGDEAAAEGSRTISIIENFLNTLPPDELPVPGKGRVVADTAATDYTAVLMGLADVETFEEPEVEEKPGRKSRKHRTEILDTFIENSKERIELQEVSPETTAQADENYEEAEEDIFTETLARIYTKQGRYDKASQIIRRIYLNNPKKSIYFADQLRFLEKLKAIQASQN